MNSELLVIGFGSQIRGTAGPRSDFDIAVLGGHPLTLEEKDSVASHIAAKFGIREDTLDVIDLWSAHPLLQYQVATEGKLLAGSQPNFIRFRVLAWKRYHDTAKFRRAREESFASRYAR